MKITKRELVKIIKEEAALLAEEQLPLFDELPTPAEPEPTVPEEEISPDPAEEKGAFEKFVDEYGDEAIAWMLVSISKGDNKDSIGAWMERFGQKNHDLAQASIQKFCDRASSWPGWGEYQGAANKACTIAGQFMPKAVAARGNKYLLKGIAMALSVIDSETINDFAAETYPDTRAGKQALKRKQARIAAQKKAKQAMKESLRRIVRRNTNQ